MLSTKENKILTLINKSPLYKRTFFMVKKKATKQVAFPFQFKIITRFSIKRNVVESI